MHGISISNKRIDEKIVKLIPKSIAVKHKLFPIKRENDSLIVAMVDPYNFIAKEDISLYTDLNIKAIPALDSEIQEFFDEYFDIQDDSVKSEFLPVVKLIDDIIERAIEMNASDIHIEPTKDNIRIRFRIDGDLHTIKRISLNYSATIVSRIKVIGNMDIAEKRIAQDGRVEVIVNDYDIDIRLSTMPTVYGEKIVLRLLNKTNFNYEIKDLGFNKKNLNSFLEIISQPHGMVLVTGPTGCGKSTTMYTVLKEINTEDKNIITVEDPVEYKIHGLNQIQVNKKAGLDFASGLRSILRQDPDYIFIGEIRDQETSRLAVRAAITGHLIFSTLHTNDSVSAIHRLMDMGIEPYLLSSSLIGVISQRLIKLLCPKCKKAYLANESQKKVLQIDGLDEVYLFNPMGCDHCNNGYLGRTAIYEVFNVDSDIRSLIDDNSNVNRIKETALKYGMTTLFDSAKELLLTGNTSFEEAMKINSM